MYQGTPSDLIDPDAPARGQAHPGDRHILDTDEGLAAGEEQSREYAAPRARVSWLAVTGLMLGVIGVLSALTGVLAPVALAVGAVGLLLALAGLAATRRPGLASRPLALTALAVSIAALVLAAMAYSGEFAWLNRDDQASWLRDWLNERLPGLDRL